MIIKNASGFHGTSLNQDCVVYSASSKDIVSVSSIQDALERNRWATQFHPFAQVMVNTLSGEFLLVRDHLGVRPLYYYYQSSQLIFGDTIPDILQQLSSRPALLDSEIINLFSDVNYYSDDTLYQGIKRVEPGHMVYCNPAGVVTKHVFWQLEPMGETLYYADERDYVEHFSALMQESVQQATEGASNLAAEFSAGMDSTAIYTACVEQGLKPTLFMHAAAPSSTSAQTYNDCYEKALIEHYQLHDIQRINADKFDPMLVFNEYAGWFAGPSPYIFELFANPLHRAVAAGGHSILLSGFGGDQGVSHPMPLRFMLPELLAKKAYKQVWHALRYETKARGSSLHALRSLLRHTPYTHPWLHERYERARAMFSSTTRHPYQCCYFKTAREAVWSFLQGPYSHEIRMRVEYSSVVAKKMGFEYRYPLLYPKLLEFFLSLPMGSQKQRGIGRYLMRSYLAHQLPTNVFESYQKKEGLSILPATMDYFRPKFLEGVYHNEFNTLPYAEWIQDQWPHKAMIKTIHAGMINMFQERQA